MPKTYYCICDVSEIKAVEIKHCKSGLGQGVMEYWSNGVREKIQNSKGENY